MWEASNHSVVITMMKYAAVLCDESVELIAHVRILHRNVDEENKVEIKYARKTGRRERILFVETKGVILKKLVIKEIVIEWSIY